MTEIHQGTEKMSMPAPPAVSDHRVQPEGVVPKQAQTYVIAGLALVILPAVLFSKNHAQPAAKRSPQENAALAPEANRQRIEALTEDLNQKQATLAALHAQQNGASDTTAPAVGMGNGASGQPAQPPRDAVKGAERELEFRSRFVSNLVTPQVTPSHDNLARSPWEQNAGTSMGSESASAQTLPQPRMADSSTALPRNADSSATSAVNGKHSPEVNLNSAHGQPYVLFEGTILDTALLNRLVGDFAGPVKVMVTNPVYSQDRQHVLIPAGTFLLGDVQKVSGFGQRRLAVRFHRMLMPDGYSVDLDQFQGLDQAGRLG